MSTMHDKNQQRTHRDYKIKERYQETVSGTRKRTVQTFFGILKETPEEYADT